MTQNRYCFDTEVFKNFFCVTFVKVDTKEIKTFIIWKNQDDRQELLDFLSNDLFLISFNGLSYDMPILRFIKNYEGLDINIALYELSSQLVSEDHRRDEDVVALRYPHFVEENIVHQDLMAMMGFIRSGVGLKQCSVNLKWHKIQDLPLEHTHKVALKDVGEIVKYNINDSLITLELYNDKNVTEARKLRESVAVDFGNEILSAADSKMANIFLSKLYEQETGIPEKEFKELRTPRTEIRFSDVILPVIRFSSPELNSLVEELNKIVVLSFEDFKFEKSVSYKGNIYTLGIGGLHTDERPAVYNQTEDQEILSMDVASFYPSIMCEYHIKPEHLEDRFIYILDKIRKERVQAKKAKNKVKAESYKIVVNATFGKLGFENYWLYDPLALIRVTVNGQLFLLMLIEKMVEKGFICVSSNTDGAEFLIPVNRKDEAMSITREWEKETKFELEFTNYKKLIKKDVNDYLAIKMDGKTKAKGIFVDTIDLKKGYSYPVIPKAINKYFKDNIPVEQTVSNCKDIFDFCISKKSGGDFQIEYHTLNGIQHLQKTNRFYISNSGGSLQKRRQSNGKTIGLFVGNNVRLLNDYDPNVVFDNYDVNKAWYIHEAKSIIEEIEPSIIQENMFSTDIDYGKRINLLGKEITKKKALSVPKKITEKEIREAKSKKIIYDVNPRYILITDLDATYSPKITAYSLSKGTINKFKIKKDIFSQIPLKYGDIVSLESFEKRPRYIKEGNTFREVAGQFEWWITNYKIIEDISEFKRKKYDNQTV